MISVTTAFKNAAKSPTHKPIGSLAFSVNGATKTAGPSAIKSFSVKQCACSSNAFTIGSTVASILKATVLKSWYDGNASAIANCEVKPYLGFDGVGTIQRGRFRVDDSLTSESGLYVTITAYDCFMSPEMDLPAAWKDPETFGQFSAEDSPEDNLSRLDVAFSFVTDNLPSGTTPAVISPDTTLRDVISRIALACGMNAMTDNEGNVCFKAPKSGTDEEIGPSMYRSASIDGRDKTVIGAFCRTYEQDGEDYAYYYPASYGDEDVVLVFSSDYVSSNSDLETIFQRMTPGSSTSYSYQGHLLDVFGLPYIEPFDNIGFTLVDGTEHMITPFTVETVYDGSMKTSLSAETIEIREDGEAFKQPEIEAVKRDLGRKIESVEKSIGLYATCPTAGATAAKTAILDGFVPRNGALVQVRFSHANTASNPTLSINGGEASPIVVAANGSTRNLSGSDIYNWSDGETVSMLYTESNGDGQWTLLTANIANYAQLEGGVFRVSDNGGADGYHVDISPSAIAMAYGANDLIRLDNGTIVIGGDLYRLSMSSGGVSIENGGSSLVASANGIELRRGTATRRPRRTCQARRCLPSTLPART